MPARIRKIRHDDETRAKIKTAAIINRLQDAFDGKVDLTQIQVSIGLGLLRKTLPDLEQREQTNFDGDRPRAITDKPMPADEWERQYGEPLTNGNGAVH